MPQKVVVACIDALIGRSRRRETADGWTKRFLFSS
jgi:hypothetical protein